MRTAHTVELAVVDGAGIVTVEVRPEVATVPALVALKALSIPRRKDGSYPAKIGSDIHDLYRLVEGERFADLLAAFRTLEEDARSWIADFLARTFTAGSSDLRYAATRMRRYSNNADAHSIQEDDLSLLGELGAELASLG